MIDIFGTLGPSCMEQRILEEMFAEGMTGIRINLSHTTLQECKESINCIKNAAEKIGLTPKILIDMQGPELRIGQIKSPIILNEGDNIKIGNSGIIIDDAIFKIIEIGMDILLDDGKILINIVEKNKRFAKAVVKRGGVLSSRKSLKLVDAKVNMPALTESDIDNIRVAKEYGVTGIMQPFVRSRDDLLEVKHTLVNHGAKDIRVYAKIENMEGVNAIELFMDICDEIVIARGDLGNSMPLWELPRVQKYISNVCKSNNKPFMVVTEMLSSMEHKKVPTRAEVNDIYNAALDGASSVMVTGETAVGDNPIEVIRYLKRTAYEAYTRIINEDISLVPYYRNDEVSLPWYQDPDTCKQVDNIDFVYDADRLHKMYDYLNTHGRCYYIRYRGNLIGDVSLCDNGEITMVISKEFQNRHIGRMCLNNLIDLAKEIGMKKVKAKIYSFNVQSIYMAQSIGFIKVPGEWCEYEYIIK